MHLCAFSQNLTVFKPDTTSWNVTYPNIDGSNILYSVLSANGKTFIYRENEFEGPHIKDSMEVKTSADNSKLWINPSVSNIDFLVYDMNLVVGDTFVNYLYNNSSTLDSQYLIVNNVSIENNRKIIGFQNNDLKFIEGIGTNEFFLFGNQYSGLQPRYLLCKSNLGQLEYASEFSDGACNIMNVSIKNIDKNDEFTLKLKDGKLIIVRINDLQNQDYVLNVYSINGEKVYSLNSKLTSVEEDFNFPKGLYFATITKNNITFNYKIIQL